MRVDGPFVAVDWGTTNRRAYLIDGDAVIAAEHDGRGVRALAAGDYPAEVAAIRGRLGDRPMLLAGMVGSSVGWREAGYVAAPAGIAEVAGAVLAIDPCTAILPGVSIDAPDHADVMRGEEVQLFGARAAGLVPADALVVQPGTHAKWATLRDGRIAHFTTAMTGELFALLRDHSILSRQLGRPAAVGPAFRDGVAAGGAGDLSARLFGVRAAGLLGRRDDADAASFVSGLLIGDEVARRLGEDSVDTVHLLADGVLGPLYAAAIEANGRAVRLVDSGDAFVSGMIHLARHLT